MFSSSITQYYLTSQNIWFKRSFSLWVLALRFGSWKKLTGCPETAEIRKEHWDVENNYHYKPTYILATLDRRRVKGLPNNCIQCIQTAGYSQAHTHKLVSIGLTDTYTHNTASRSIDHFCWILWLTYPIFFSGKIKGLMKYFCVGVKTNGLTKNYRAKLFEQTLVVSSSLVSLKQRFSNVWSPTSSISIVWEFVENAGSWATLQIYWIQNSGPAVYVLTSHLSESMHSGLGTIS